MSEKKESNQTINETTKAGNTQTELNDEQLADVAGGVVDSGPMKWAEADNARPRHNDTTRL